MDIKLDHAEDITMTYTGLIPGKKGSVVHVSFNRTVGNKQDNIEIVMPSCRVLNNKGFEEEEVGQLRIYLKAHKQEILQSAKQINHDLIYKL